MRALRVVRSSLVTAYVAAVGTTVWAIYAELDRSPRPNLTVATEPTEAKPRVPDHEWRAWARQHASLQKRVAALVTAQQSRPADAAPVASPVPTATQAGQTAWSPPEPALKPVQWSADRTLLLAVNPAEEATQPSSSAATESFWSRVLTLFEPASASTMAGGGDSARRGDVPAGETAAVQRSAAQRSSGQAGVSAGGDAARDPSPPSDPKLGERPQHRQRPQHGQ